VVGSGVDELRQEGKTKTIVFGFVRLTTTPWLYARLRVRGAASSSGCSSPRPSRRRTPSRKRYAAPAYLTASNAAVDARIRKDSPAAASATYVTVPVVIPATEASPRLRPISMLRVTT
jgi:hypothetical protein